MLDSVIDVVCAGPPGSPGAQGVALESQSPTEEGSGSFPGASGGGSAATGGQGGNPGLTHVQALAAAVSVPGVPGMYPAAVNYSGGAGNGNLSSELVTLVAQPQQQSSDGTEENVRSAAVSTALLWEPCREGVCHKCAAPLTRVDTGRKCRMPGCGVKWHANDCGKHLRSIGIPLEMVGYCPRCSKCCGCGGGPLLCHATRLRQVRKGGLTKRKRASASGSANPYAEAQIVRHVAQVAMKAGISEVYSSSGTNKAVAVSKVALQAALAEMPRVSTNENIEATQFCEWLSEQEKLCTDGSLLTPLPSAVDAAADAAANVAAPARLRTNRERPPFEVFKDDLEVLMQECLNGTELANTSENMGMYGGPVCENVAKNDLDEVSSLKAAGTDTSVPVGLIVARKRKPSAAMLGVDLVSFALAGAATVYILDGLLQLICTVENAIGKQLEKHDLNGQPGSETASGVGGSASGVASGGHFSTGATAGGLAHLGARGGEPCDVGFSSGFQCHSSLRRGAHGNVGYLISAALIAGSAALVSLFVYRIFSVVTGRAQGTLAAFHACKSYARQIGKTFCF